GHRLRGAGRERLPAPRGVGDGGPALLPGTPGVPGTLSAVGRPRLLAGALLRRGRPRPRRGDRPGRLAVELAARPRHRLATGGGRAATLRSLGLSGLPAHPSGAAGAEPDLCPG